jgi:hypothetical protein
MSAIVDFPLHRIPPVRVADRNSIAEIVIFPGVRVERMEFDLATRLESRGSRRPAAGRAVNAEQNS